MKRPSEGRAKYYYDKQSTEPGDADVVTCNVRAGENGHTATFPPDLIRPRILSSSPKGGIVVDPFCGSGRVLAEAVTLGRRAAGFDLCHEYAASSERSARKATPELPYA